MANLDIDLDFDFGFTTSSEEEIKQEGTDKARHMYDAIMPLLTILYLGLNQTALSLVAYFALQRLS